MCVCIYIYTHTQIAQICGFSFKVTPCGERCAGPRVAVTLVYVVYNDISVIVIDGNVTFSSSVTGMSCVIIQIVEFWK
jgi:hypothetical protein